MFVLFAFNGLLSQLVSLGERKSQALTADRGLNESFVRVDAKLPFDHRTRFGAIAGIERNLATAGLRVIETDLETQSSQRRNHSFANVGIHLIDQTSDE